jgi:hypothetical protein
MKQYVKRLSFIFILLTTLLPISAQKAVVEDYSTDIIFDKLTHAVMHFKKTTTILHESASDFGFFSCTCSNSNQLISFKGQVTDASGNIIRKMKIKDLKKTEYSPYLAIDDYIMYLEYTPSSFPVTVTYEWKLDCKDNLVEFPPFCPQTDYNVDVKRATYHLAAPQELGVRYAFKNISQPAEVYKNKAGAQVISLEMTDIPRVKKIPYTRPIYDRVPIAYFAPSLFVYYETQGSLSNWKEFGMWQFGMLRGRDALPEDIRNEIHQLTDSLGDDRQKVEAIYNLLGKKTRYVAILFGIGGQRPASAIDVCSSGYGDCKGLTNFMRAMLQEVGITSNYTTISTRNRQLLKDFASVGQMNHVILQVPIKNDTIWLECTNPQLPFGYVHGDIAGHDAIEVSRAGGRLVHIPAYPDSTNLARNQIRLQLDGSGIADIDVSSVFYNLRMESRIPVYKMGRDEQKKAILRMLYAPQAEIDKSEFKMEGPVLSLDAHVRSKNYTTATGKRLFVPVCPIRRDTSIPAVDEERLEDFYIETGYCDEDEIIITLPEGSEIEATPSDVIINESFASFHSIIKRKGSQIIITNRLLVKSGTYDKSSYSRFIEFMKRVNTAYGQKVVLKKSN